MSPIFFVSPMKQLELLRNKYNILFHVQHKRIYNLIAKVKDEKKFQYGSNHFQALITELANYKLQNDSWEYDYDCNAETLKLERIMYMHPVWKKRLYCYNDVAFLDTTQKTNMFNMPLAILTIIDSCGKSQIAAVAMFSDEQSTSFSWFFEKITHHINIYPKVLFTDGDPAINVAINNCWKNTKHLLCIYHITYTDFPRKLVRILGPTVYRQFIKDFWCCRNTVNCLDFEDKWSSMIQRYAYIFIHPIFLFLLPRNRFITLFLLPF